MGSPADFRARVAERIREVRVAAGKSQEQVAERLGCAVPNYRRMERGKQNLTIDTLYRIAIAIGVDPDALLAAPAGGGPRRVARSRARRPGDAPLPEDELEK